MPLDSAERDLVELHVIQPRQFQIFTWLWYRVSTHFLTPSDGWSFAVAAADIPADDRNAIRPGAEIRLTVNGHEQLSGFITSVTFRASPGSGYEITIEGHDKLGPAVAGNADPRLIFKPPMTILDVLKGVLGPYGFSRDLDFLIDNDENRNVLSGSRRGTPTTKKGKPLKKFALHQLRPYPNEGALAFVARICQRHGIWPWLSADGTKIIVGKPDFYQGPKNHIVRLLSGEANNILDGSVTLDLGEQPSIVVADGFSGGGEFGRSKILAVGVNPALDVDATAEIEHWTKKGASYIPFSFRGPKMRCPTARPMYLHDDESKTQEQLENFVRREMALRLRKSLTARYVVRGHVGEIYSSGHAETGSIWAVDTIAHVRDELSDLDEPLWVLSRTFSKSRNQGSTTEVELIRPHSLEL